MPAMACGFDSHHPQSAFLILGRHFFCALNLQSKCNKKNGPCLCHSWAAFGLVFRGRAIRRQQVAEDAEKVALGQGQVAFARVEEAIVAFKAAVLVVDRDAAD